MNNLLNISPIDGRYQEKTRELANYFSEYSLIKYRITIEIYWLIYLINNNIINKKITKKDEKNLLNIISSYNISEASRVKEIEKKTKHDVKAIEYYLQEKLQDINLSNLIPFIHFALTSEDINNTSYNLMLHNALKDIYLPKLLTLINLLDEYSITYRDVAILGHTHGQIATPTTVGKELKVFSFRLKTLYNLIKDIKLRSKFSGTVGNYNAHIIAYPEVDWIKETKKFIESLNLEYNPVTTQIESHDILCVVLSYIKILNNIIKDLNSDMWLYISHEYFKEKANSQEVGSSVMPHKVNPINHENSMANIEISNSIIDALVNNLSISRMQRDLSDSSKLRNIGVILSHSIISIEETITGLNKIEVNKEYIEKELEDHYEVLCEAIQTILRKNDIKDAYEMLKELSRGKTINKSNIIDFIKKADISKEDKEKLMNLTPASYIGLSKQIVDNN